MKKIGTNNLLQKMQEESLCKKQGLNLKEQKGITLIALVVTIVVLLILAGVTITFVLGEGGILDLAKEAARKTNEAVTNDLSDMNTLAGDIQNLLGGSSETVETPPSEESTDPSPEPPTEVASSETIEKYIDINEQFTVEVKDSDGEVSINFQDNDNGVVSIEKNTVTGVKIGDAILTATWNESNTATINVHVYNPDTIGAPKRIEDYGKIVVDYEDTEKNENTKKYRLFYQDKNYTYIISDELISTSGTLQSLYTAAGKTSGADVKDWGQRLNPMLINAKPNNQDYTFFSSDNKYTNILGVAYLTDTTENSPWKKYKDSTDGNGDALYAIGSPTLELFAASYNTMSTGDNGKKDNIIPTVEQYGYRNNTSNDWLTDTQREGIYNTGSWGLWWLASPYFYDSDYVFRVSEGSGYLGYSYVSSTNAVRPLVCIPTSKFNTKYGDNLKWNNELGN